MLSEVTFAFLDALSENNNTKRMHLHIDLYRQEKGHFIDLVQKLIDKMKTYDDAFEGLTAKECLFRQNKDIRFTRNKRPYKKHFGARISPDGKNSDYAGMYIHIEKGRSYISIGMRQPSAVAWKKVRQHMASHYQELVEILDDRLIGKIFGAPRGERTSRLLKIYKDHPARRLLKYKSLYFHHFIADSVVISPGFMDIIIEEWLLMKPFLDFLNAGLEE